MQTLLTPVVTGAIVAVSSTVLLAQAPSPAKKAQPAAATPTAAAAPAKPAGPPLPAPPANYQYASEGRRDPFMSLLNRGTDSRSDAAAVKRPDGVPGLDTIQIVVRGIMQSRGSHIAMVSGAEGKVYTVRAGDRLFDGVIRAITPQAVVILQEVNDPLSLEKQREVRKFLRGGEVK